MQSFSLAAVSEASRFHVSVGGRSLWTCSGHAGFARVWSQGENFESTHDCSGDWALELRYWTGSSVAPLPKTCAILVSCRRTRSQQRVWFCLGNASRSFGSGHIDPARGRERKLRVKTRIVSLDPHPRHLAAGFKLVGGS
jgi:hypothetical protein